ncbi:MAG: hypothetical protein ACFFEF_07985 [Candidatus Thorarchaeota archaeon]
MIVKSILYDLVGAKVWSSTSFINMQISNMVIQQVVEKYFTALQDGSFKDGMTILLESFRVCVYQVTDGVLFIGVYHASEISSKERQAIQSLIERLNPIIKEEGPREASKSFPEIAASILPPSVKICFISPAQPSIENASARAVAKLLAYTKTDDRVFSSPVRLGPFNVRVSRIPLDEAVKGNLKAPLSDTDAVVVIIGRPLHEKENISKIIGLIQAQTDAHLLLAPGSDDELELVRIYEAETKGDLCDSVTPNPSYLLLSVLAMIGMSDVHPELASEIWFIDNKIDETPRKAEVKEEAESLGHQAFFVVDKSTGIAVYSYYFEEMAKVHERVPNIVAAITTFKLGQSEDAKTSVIQVGRFVYALIEYENLIFTLITGQTNNVDEIRSQFSFLPDLWKDEALEELESTEDPYTSHPFTIKLLATLPPEMLQKRMVPHRIKEPKWDSFKSSQVRDFLHAVWDSIDGTREMGHLVTGSGPQMTLGAIHFLKSMGCINLRARIDASDIPTFVGILDDELKSTYSHIEKITLLADGTRTIKEIGQSTGIDTNVLITVMTGLYSRGKIKLDK